MPVAGGKRDVDSAVAEADDISHSIAVHIRQLARIGILAAPSAGADAVIGKLESGLGKVPVPSRQRDNNSAVAEPDDVGHVIAVHVCQFARVLTLVCPAARTDAEVVELKGRTCERPDIIVDDGTYSKIVTDRGAVRRS